MTTTGPRETPVPQPRRKEREPFAMLALHALPSGLTFDFEPFLVSDLKLDISRDRASSSSDVCKFYLKGYCHKGAACPQRHARNDRTVVCKHWLRGLCKKGDLCEFLHEYNLKKMPECWFYAKYGECSNPECMYMHVDPESKIKDCPWYLTGFCKLGLECRGKHARKPICQNYLTGFCPKGPDCTFGHPKFDPPKYNDASAGGGRNDQTATTSDNTNSDGSRRPFRSLDQVTCFKCSEKGHYANHCTKRRKFAQDEPSVGQPIPSVS